MTCLFELDTWEYGGLALFLLFMAKTQNPFILGDRFKEFTILPHHDFLDRYHYEVLLCPIRAIQMYLSRTKQFCSDCKNPFFLAMRRKKLMCQNTWPFWLRFVIDHACHSARNDDGSFVRVRAHGVQEIGAFLISKKNCAVQQPLKVGT